MYILIHVGTIHALSFQIAQGRDAGAPSPATILAKRAAGRQVLRNRWWSIFSTFWQACNFSTFWLARYLPPKGEE
jgi:hypothetical protein